MKKLLIALLAFSAHAQTWKGDQLWLRPGTLPATGSNGMMRVDSATNKLKKYNEAIAAWQEISGSGGGSGRNLVNDPGFEDGGSTWTASGGSYTIATSGSNLLFDLKSGVFNASASGQKLCSQLVSIPNGFYGSNGEAAAYFKTAATDYIFYASDGSNILGSSQVVTASSDATQQGVNFIFPKSGSIQFCVESQSNAADIVIDDTYIGAATNLILTGRPFVGFKAMSATPTAASFGSGDPVVFSSLGTDGFDTEGGYNTSTGIYTVKVAGKYEVTCSLSVTGTYTAAGASNVYLIKNSVAFAFVSADVDAGNVRANPSATALIDLAYGDELECHPESNATGPGFTNYEPANYFEAFLIQPTDSIGIAPNKPWYVDAYLGGADPSLGTSTVGSLQGIEDVNLSIAAESGSLPVEIPCSSTNPSSPGTCGAGNGQVGVAFTPTSSGRAEVCADFSIVTQFSGGGGESYYAAFKWVQTTNTSQTPLATANSAAEVSWSGIDNVQLSTGRRACGTFDVIANQKQTLRLFYQQVVTGSPTNFSFRANQNPGNQPSNTHITVRMLDQQTPAPIIVNGVQSSYPGNSRLEWMGLTSVCTGSPCNVDFQSGAFAPTITNSGTGNYTATFLNPWSSASYVCTTSYTGGAAALGHCQATAIDASSVNILCNNDTGFGGSDDASFTMMCVGPK
jgi:hypothetical protein